MTRRLARISAFSAALLLIAAAGLALPRLGSFLVVEDPLAKADAIFVLGGTYFERPLEAVDLYHEGWAPRILLMRQIADDGEVELRRRGIDVPSEVDIQIRVMEQLGVPRQAIEALGEQGSTSEESETVRRLVEARGWTRVIVVTSKQHTRRAALAMHRRLAGTGATVVMRASRYDASDVEHWWRRRATLRFTLFETQRYLSYWLHLAD